MKVKPKSGQAFTVPAGIGAGVAAAMGITQVMAAVFAWLIASGKLGEQFVGYGSLITMLAAAAAGAAVAICTVKEKLAITSLATGLVYYLLLIAINAMFFEGRYQAMGVTALVIAGGCLCVYLAAIGKGKRKKHVNRKGRSW